MADIFLSYARADQPRIAKLAAALEEAGYSLWWDRNIEGGHQFAKDIQRELDAASTVLVAWSANSVESHWVLDEAGFARDEGKLVPIALDDTMPPLGFRQLQAIDFSGWPRAKEPLEALTATLDRRLDRATVATPSAPATRKTSRRPLLIALAALALVAVAIAGWFAIRGGTGAADDPATIAVLPFSNSAGDQYDAQQTAYPAAIIDGLGHIPDIDILSARTSFALADQGLSSTELAARLEADYLVEGDIQVDGNILRVTTRLIDGQTGRPIWTDSRSRDTSLPELQRQSIRYVAAALQGYLGIGLGYLPADSSLSGEALDLYRRGMTLLLTRADAAESVASYNAFKRVVELAPNSADAHAALAYALTDIGPFTLSMAIEDFRSANHEAYERALELDPDSLFGLIAKAETIHKEDGDIAQALDLFERVLAQEPNFGPAHELLAEVYASAGDYRASLAAADRALALSPLDEQLVSNRAAALRALGQYTNIRNEALACKVNCERVGLAWMTAMVALVPADELDIEVARLTEFARQGEVEEELIVDLENYVRGVVRREEIGAAGETFGSFYDTVYRMRVGDEEAGLDALERYLGRIHAGTLQSFLNDDRFTPSPRIRAHPRYRAFFDIPKFKAVADYRRERGITTGLPIAPEEVAAEEARLRERGLL